MICPRIFEVLLMLVTTVDTVAANTTPPSDSQVQSAITQWRERLDAGAEASAAADATLDALLVGSGVAELSAPQLSALAPLLDEATRYSVPVRDRLKALAQAPDADGAIAAILLVRLTFSATGGNPEAYRLALTHPGLADALQQEADNVVFNSLANAGESLVNDLAAEIMDAESILNRDLPPRGAAAMTGYYQALVMLGARVDRPTRERVRRRIIDLIRANLEIARRDEDQRCVELLQERLELMMSIAGEDELVGHDAPALTFLWASGLSVSNLSDLKGRVVLLDFWTTACGPCVRSFPKIRALQARYRNAEVVILGVTSVQGRHVAPGGGVTQTADDPQREFALMREYITQQDVTWPVVFTKQDVYNPDFSVDQTGIPHLTLVDHHGVVRYNGMNPTLMTADDLAAMIDSLLVEAGMSAPPRPPSASSQPS